MCWRNAAAESFFAPLTKEMYYQQTFGTRSLARFAVAEYIDVFCNRQRLDSTLGYRTPARKPSPSIKTQQHQLPKTAESLSKNLDTLQFEHEDRIKAALHIDI